MVTRGNALSEAYKPIEAYGTDTSSGDKAKADAAREALKKYSDGLKDDSIRKEFLDTLEYNLEEVEKGSQTYDNIKYAMDVLSGKAKEDTKKDTQTKKKAEKTSDAESTQGYVAEEVELTDRQGNPINKDGSLKLESVTSTDEITDEDFMNPIRSIKLPKVSEGLNKVIGADNKPLIIKKNIFTKNNTHHHFTPKSSRAIQKAALYDTEIVGQTQPISRPNYWLAIKIDKESPIVVLEVNRNNENIEIVGWSTLDERNLKRIQRQAKREDGELLILTSSKDAAASLSTLPSNLTSVSKANKVTGNEQGTSAKDGKNSIVAAEAEVNTEPTETQKEAGNYKIEHVKVASETKQEDTSKTKKINLKNHVAKKGEKRLALKDIFHKDGKAYAINGSIMIVLPSNYEKSLEGVVTSVKGEPMNVDYLDTEIITGRKYILPSELDLGHIKSQLSNILKKIEKEVGKNGTTTERMHHAIEMKVRSKTIQMLYDDAVNFFEAVKNVKPGISPNINQLNPSPSKPKSLPQHVPQETFYEMSFSEEAVPQVSV